MARYLVSQLVKDVLEDIDPKYPELSNEEIAQMQELRPTLIGTAAQDEQQGNAKECE